MWFAPLLIPIQGKSMARKRFPLSTALPPFTTKELAVDLFHTHTKKCAQILSTSVWSCGFWRAALYSHRKPCGTPDFKMFLYPAGLSQDTGTNIALLKGGQSSTREGLGWKMSGLRITTWSRQRLRSRTDSKHTKSEFKETWGTKGIRRDVPDKEQCIKKKKEQCLRKILPEPVPHWKQRDSKKDQWDGEGKGCCRLLLDSLEPSQALCKLCSLLQSTQVQHGGSTKGSSPSHAAPKGMEGSVWSPRVLLPLLHSPFALILPVSAHFCS